MGQDIFDVIIILTLVAFSIRGFLKGFVAEVAGIVSLLGGFWVAHHFHPLLSPRLTFISEPAWRQLCRLWRQSGGWAELLRRLVWEAEAESLRARTEHVQIMTMHASKGLEFRAVFLPGLEDGLLPLRREVLMGQPVESAIPQELLEEERRLLYVALTRAAQGVYASRCAQRSFYGHSLRLPASPFLSLVEDAFHQSTLKARTRQTQEHLSLF